MNQTVTIRLGDSIILTFHVSPLAGGHRLCDIDSL